METPFDFIRFKNIDNYSGANLISFFNLLNIEYIY